MTPNPSVSTPGAIPYEILHCLFSDSPNAIALRSPEGRVLAVNRAFERLFLYNEHEAAGRDLKDLLRPDCGEWDAPGEWDADGAAMHIETRRKRSDGALVDVNLSYSQVPESCGRPGAFVIYRDIAAQKETESKVLAARKKYRSIFENAVEGIFQTTPSGRYLDVNPALAGIYGFASPDALREHFKDIKNELYVEPGRRDDFVALMERDRKITNFESRVRKKDGEIIWITENARTVYGEDGRIAYFEGTVMDITERKRAEEALEAQRAYFTQLFENSPQAIALIDAKRNVVDCNKGFEELFGYRTKDIIGFGMRPFIVPEPLLAECESFRNSILGGSSVQRETSRRHKDGRLIPVSMIGFPVRIAGELRGIIYIYQDISERKAFEEQITHQAFHDALTGLPNRTLFAERLERAIQRCKRRPSSHYAALMIDLNKFKAVNDSLGHAAGDALLKEVARRLAACVRSVDTVARLGGDEFAVILEELAGAKEVLRVAKRILSVLGQPFRTCGADVTPGASIGIVARIADYDTAEETLRDADIAMYRAKEQGKGHLIFDNRMRQEILDSISLETELREALDKGGMVLHYQPIVSVMHERLEGFEALVRWDHPLRGMVPPDRFIPLAEETGLIVELGKWVISEACHSLRRWRDAIPGAGDLCMSVNVSIRQFAKKGLVEHVARVLKDTDIPPGSLKLEITESVIMQDADETLSELHRLKKLGVRIAIDDFGTGYSSLSYLRHMPIDDLKIDRSFISGADNPEENAQIVISIINLARSLGLSVIAEGVEDETQLERLRDLRCDKAQGYMFSKPVSAPFAEDLIREAALRPEGSGRGNRKGAAARGSGSGYVVDGG